MADDSADSAEVHRIVRLVVVEGWLQDSRREGDVVQLRVVTRIDGHGWIWPVILVDGLADFIELTLEIKFVGAQRISQSVSANDFYTGVVAPLVGVADSVGDCLQLNLSLLARLWRHPGKSLDVLSERLLDCVHHLEGSFFAASPEGKLDIFLSHSLAEVAIGVVDATL